MKIKQIFKKDTITGGTVAYYFRSPFYLWCCLHAPEEEKDEESDYQEMLKERGNTHERSFISKNYPEMVPVKIETTEDVLKALKQGIKAFDNLQVFDLKSNFAGIPDILEKRAGKSRFGNFYYIVKEIKSAKTLRKFHKMQTAFYNLIIGLMQDHIPDRFYVINKEGIEQECLFSDFKDELLSALDEIKEIIKGKQVTPTLDMDYPWANYSEKKAFETNDISLINGVSNITKQKLNQIGLISVKDLHKTDINALKSIRGIGEKKVLQFKRSAEALIKNKPITFNKAILPKRKVEIFFDIESTMPDEEFGVSEQKNYLFGVIVRKKGKARYIPIVAHKLEEEEKAFRKFLDLVQKQKDFIIYYFHNFEKTQLERLCRDYSVEGALKKKLFDNMIDLRLVLKDSVAFPTTKTGLKEIAKYLGFSWRHKDVNAQESMAWYFTYMEKGDKEKLQKIIDYNEDDCRATMLIKDWVEENLR